MIRLRLLVRRWGNHKDYALKQITIFISALFLLGSAIAAEPVVKILDIAGKSKSTVASVLGKAKSCTSGKYGEKCIYEKGQIEIVFIKGKADWITVEALDHISFDSSSLTALGLNGTEPTFKNANTMRWDGINGLLEVSIFPAGKIVDYAYIKTNTR